MSAPPWGPQLLQTPKFKSITVTDSSVFPMGTWTPTLSFTTPGDLSVTYTTRLADYLDLGRVKLLNFNILTSAFTHTTASGSLIISGIPANVVTLAGYAAHGALAFGGITKAGYTAISASLSSANSSIAFVASGSGVSPGNVVAADVPSGGTVNLAGTIVYRVS